MRYSTLLAMITTAVISASCASPPRMVPQASTEPLGTTKESAIEVCMPSGERDYVAKLVCPSGEHPTFRRLGNVGTRYELPKNMSRREMNQLFENALSGAALKPGETDYHVIDAYAVECGEKQQTVFIDMYHCSLVRPPDSAPPGFTIDHN